MDERGEVVPIRSALGLTSLWAHRQVSPLTPSLFYIGEVILVLSRGLGCILSHAIPLFFGHLIFACFFACFFYLPSYCHNTALQ